MRVYSMSTNIDEHDIEVLLQYTDDRELIINTLKKFDGDLARCILDITNN